ncbi:hypothetical protein V8G54_022990 [Vigna mungo]|uniref:Uncharacterized protein n=1 Tax=Vigna mungo TaxID=3915 RepID=A0AAQ3RNR1_VIGMU
MISTTSETALGPGLANSLPLTSRITSPASNPSLEAAEKGLTSGTLTPGKTSCSGKPTDRTWAKMIRNAKIMLATTPAETTITLSNIGLFLSKFASSTGISLSGSLSGNPTKPPRGKALMEYSTFLALNFAKIGPNPTANLLT